MATPKMRGGELWDCSVGAMFALLAGAVRGGGGGGEATRSPEESSGDERPEGEAGGAKGRAKPPKDGPSAAAKRRARKKAAAMERQNAQRAAPAGETGEPAPPPAWEKAKGGVKIKGPATHAADEAPPPVVNSTFGALEKFAADTTKATTTAVPLDVKVVPRYHAKVEKWVVDLPLPSGGRAVLRLDAFLPSWKEPASKHAKASALDDEEPARGGGG